MLSILVMNLNCNSHPLKPPTQGIVSLSYAALRAAGKTSKVTGAIAMDVLSLGAEGEISDVVKPL